MNAIVERFKIDLANLPYEDRMELWEFLDRNLEEKSEPDTEMQTMLRRRMAEVESSAVAPIDIEGVFAELDRDYP